MARKRHETFPLIVGGAEVGEIRVDVEAARAASNFYIRHVVVAADQRTDAYPIVRDALQDVGATIIDFALCQEFNVPKPETRGRKATLDPWLLHEEHRALRPAMTYLHAALRRCRNPDAAWMDFKEKHPDLAAILDPAAKPRNTRGIPGWLLHHGRAAAKLTDTVLTRYRVDMGPAFTEKPAIRLTSRDSKVTFLSLEKRRREGGRAAKKRNRNK